MVWCCREGSVDVQYSADIDGGSIAPNIDAVQNAINADLENFQLDAYGNDTLEVTDSTVDVPTGDGGTAIGTDFIIIY